MGTPGFLRVARRARDEAREQWGREAGGPGPEPPPRPLVAGVGLGAGQGGRGRGFWEEREGLAVGEGRREHSGKKEFDRQAGAGGCEPAGNPGAWEAEDARTWKLETERGWRGPAGAEVQGLGWCSRGGPEDQDGYVPTAAST